MDPRHSNIWDDAKALIRNEINPQSYDTWLAPIRLVGFSDEGVTLEAPNKFFLGWVVEKYRGLIEAALFKCAGRKVSADFVVPAQGGAADTATSIVAGAIEEAARRKAAQTPPKQTGINPKYTFDDFVIGPSNRFAHAACVAVSETPAKAYNPLFIYGGVGLGKTHLMYSIGNKIASSGKGLKILYISSEQFTNHLISAIQNRAMTKFRQVYRGVDVLLIDDIQFIRGKEATQEEFFHTFNALHDAHKQIVLSADRSPKDITGLEERLVSRFEWGLVTDIQPPDLETRIAILRKKVEKEGVFVPNDAAFFIAGKIKSNIRELEGALIRVVAYAKLMGKEITPQLVKDVLKDMVLEDEIRVSVELIQKKVAEHFNVKLAEIKGKRRNRAVVYPRQIAMYLARDLTDHSLPEIGSFFGGRDHTTVLHACEKVSVEIKKNKNTKGLLNKLVAALKA